MRHDAVVHRDDDAGVEVSGEACGLFVSHVAHAAVDADAQEVDATGGIRDELRVVEGVAGDVGAQAGGMEDETNGIARVAGEDDVGGDALGDWDGATANLDGMEAGGINAETAHL